MENSVSSVVAHFSFKVRQLCWWKPVLRVKSTSWIPSLPWAGIRQKTSTSKAKRSLTVLCTKQILSLICWVELLETASPPMYLLCCQTHWISWLTLYLTLLTLIETQTWKLCHWPSRSIVGWMCCCLDSQVVLVSKAKTWITKVKWLFMKSVATEVLQIPSSPMSVAVSFTQTLQELLCYLKRDTAVHVSVNQSV